MLQLPPAVNLAEVEAENEIVEAVEVDAEIDSY